MACLSPTLAIEEPPTSQKIQLPFRQHLKTQLNLGNLDWEHQTLKSNMSYNFPKIFICSLHGSSRLTQGSSNSSKNIPSRSLTAPWKMMVAWKLLSYWEGNFSGVNSLLNFGRVSAFVLQLLSLTIDKSRKHPKLPESGYSQAAWHRLLACLPWDSTTSKEDFPKTRTPQTKSVFSRKSQQKQMV